MNDILSMPEVLACFTSKSPHLDIVNCLEQRRTVLVNTGMAKIGLEASQLIGRYMIGITLSAAYARGLDAPPAFLYIDEFQDFVDDTATARQLRLAREYRLGIICAHQNMFCEELNESLRAAISGNTAIKYCAKVFGADRAYMLRDLGCSDEFLDQQVIDRSKKEARFACTVKGHPPASMAVTYPAITQAMQMDSPDSARAVQDISSAWLHRNSNRNRELEQRRVRAHQLRDEYSAKRLDQTQESVTRAEEPAIQKDHLAIPSDAKATHRTQAGGPVIKRGVHTPANPADESTGW